MTAVSLHYTVDGPSDGPVLLLGSSLGTTGALWEPQLAALTKELRVVRYDHRGHGRSPVPPGPYRLDELASDVLAIVDSLGVDRFRIGGISLGGMVAMWLGSHVPDRVERMVLVCTSAKIGPPEMWQERARTVRAEGMGSIADTLLGRWVPAEFATPPARHRREPAGDAAEHAGRGLRRLLRRDRDDGPRAQPGSGERPDLGDRGARRRVHAAGARAGASQRASPVPG